MNNELKMEANVYPILPEIHDRLKVTIDDTESLVARVHSKINSIKINDNSISNFAAKTNDISCFTEAITVEIDKLDSINTNLSRILNHLDTII